MASSAASSGDIYNGQGSPKKLQHYDFIEVGTSNFRTLTQYLAWTDTSCWMGLALRTWDREKVVGIAVEPVGHLLHQLPNLPGVHK
eukprot:7414182-Prorocentrum_lima.AAC.1